MTTIGPGTLVECIDDSGDQVPLLVTLGRVYECSSVDEFGSDGFWTSTCARDKCGSIGLRLVGINERPADGLFCPNRFVPIGKRGMFDNLLVAQPAPAPEEPKRAPTKEPVHT